MLIKIKQYIIKMTLTNSQNIKFLELFKTVEILFNNINFGLVYSEIEDAWLIGSVLRDLLLFKNPQINHYDFYLQVEHEMSIYPWLSKLAEERIDFEILEKKCHINNEQIFQVIIVSLIKFGVNKEIHVYVGNVEPRKFILENLSITNELIGLDIADLLVSLGNNQSINQIIKKFFFTKEYLRDIKNKNINILKQKWMLNKNSYEYLEDYLEKTYRDLGVLGFK